MFSPESFTQKLHVSLVDLIFSSLPFNSPLPPLHLQVAGDSCGSGESLPGPRKLPRAVLLHREAPEVLSNWSYPGGKKSTGVLLFVASFFVSSLLVNICVKLQSSSRNCGTCGSSQTGSVGNMSDKSYDVYSFQQLQTDPCLCSWSDRSVRGQRLHTPATSMLNACFVKNNWGSVLCNKNAWERPFIVTSPRHTCAINVSFNQYLDASRPSEPDTKPCSKSGMWIWCFHKKHLNSFIL